MLRTRPRRLSGHPNVHNFSMLLKVLLAAVLMLVESESGVPLQHSQAMIAADSYGMLWL